MSVDLGDWSAFAIRWTGFKPIQGIGVMRIRIIIGILKMLTP
jgi:hypothetical protein